MDATISSKTIFFLLTWHLLISKGSSSTLQLGNHENSANNPTSHNSIPSSPFDSRRFKNIQSNRPYEEKISRFKQTLDEFAEWIQNYEQLPALNEVTREPILDKISYLKYHSSLKAANQLLLDFYNHLKDFETLLVPLRENSTGRVDETNKLHDIFVLLNDLEVHLNDLIKKENEIATLKPKIDECVGEIKSYRFESVEKKLLEINHDRRINLVVREVYSSGKENFYTLLNLADYFKNNVKNALLVYEAVLDEMTLAEDENLFKLLLLVRRLRSLIAQNPTLKIQIESFLDVLKNLTRVAAIEEISNSFILDQLPKIEPYIAELAKTGIQDMNALIVSVMDRISRKLATKHLSAVIRSDNGLCVNETNSTPLPFRLKRVLSWGKYCTMNQEMKKIAQRATNSSPVSIGLGPIEYCEKVCIMNANYDEYLYDPDSSECSDKRNTSCPAYTTTNAKSSHLAWNLKPTGRSKFQISSYIGNYTLFVDDKKWDDERRVVSTRLASQDGDKFEWQFESDGDFVYIKNSHYQEYLSVSVKGYISNVTTIDLKSMVTTSKRLRNVFTFIRKKLTPDCYWTIVECP